MRILTLILTSMVVMLLVFVPVMSQAKVVSMSASTHVLALNDDGTVWAWGDNKYGQLGIGTMGESEKTPRKVLINNVTAISAGQSISLALKNDGTVWAWGYGEDGWLGDDGTMSRSTPVQVKGLADIVAINSIGKNCYALKNDGTVWAWGDNGEGGIGDGTTELRSTPVQIKSLTDIKALGEKCSFAIKNDGTIYAWGHIKNVCEDSVTYTGIGGLPGSSPVLTPYRVEDIDNVKQVSSYKTYSICLKEDGTVYGWGTNHFGELGDGTMTTSYELLPCVKTNIADITKISTMESHCVALKKDGTVWEWGRYIDRKGTYDNAGLPITDKQGEGTPVMVNGLDGIVDINAGFMCCIALKDDGTIWGWGRNDHKQLGDQKTVVPHPILIFQTPEQTIKPEDSNDTIPIVTPNTGITPTPEGTTTDPNVSVRSKEPGMINNSILLSILGIAIIAGGAIYLLMVKKK